MMQIGIIVLNVFSIVASILVIAVIIGIRCYRKTLVDRMSFRLTAYIATLDAVLSGVLIGFSFTDSVFVTRCLRVIALGVDLSSIFLTMNIALNLQLIFLNNKRVTMRYEYFYVFGSLGLGLIVAVLSGIYRARTTSLVLPVVVFVAVTYCLSVVIMIVYRLIRSKDGQRDQARQLNALSDSNVRRAVVRILLYPLVLIVAQLPFAIAFVLLLTCGESCIDINIGNTPVTLVEMSIYTMSLQGILNSVAFMFDPALRIVVVMIKNDMVSDYFYSEHQVFEKDHKPTIHRWLVHKYLVPHTEECAKISSSSEPLVTKDIEVLKMM
ncbi:hypothetical protein K493DRAFT_299717 [Basidiobolus meristosporus CBS 931.73]|uniref:G-protein coupled receptors family 1 profile domain-containing protein n=1 Tax=Basidiobolus meristosporus CBS 931.73 TaxID=1314790 RepID=A0A1Y1YLH2_9FUNG|nr:hypothetical protein K493DRAFT_299717 [Basidiobolus meristosporus CBS 931.73]|eukprot:ORX98860.1 hypothetical protein K493DRAFT_299717 [Basidiobolus meristosporus CBS 931.73]